jgi:tetratricopeptide (TPR) repeat protein
MTQRSVRELRVALAAALSKQPNDATEVRAEALSLLDRALKEPGASPPDGEIHRLAGALLERANPAAAFTHYFLSATASVDEKSARRACALLDNGDQAVVLSAMEEKLQQWAAAYRDTDAWNVWVALLAVALLRLSGHLADALAVLERVPVDGGPDLGVVGPSMVELLLLAGRVGEARGMLDRIEGADPAELRLARARCMFWSRDFDGALAELGPEDGLPPSVEASVLRAMSLIGLERTEEALLLLSSRSDPSLPDLVRAQGVAHLHQYDYTAAQAELWSAFSSEPTSVESLLLTTQLGLEGLGDLSQKSRQEQISPTTDDSDVLAHARRPLRQLVDEELAGVTSRWLAMQDVARADDDRYRYFRCELLRETRKATGGHLTTTDLTGLEGLSSTTLLQDGILAELRGDALTREGRRGEAAAEYDEATRQYGDNDLLARALRCARKALRVEPNLARSATAGTYAHDWSYQLKSDLQQVWALVDTAHGQLERSIIEHGAADPSFSEAARALAWLRLRRTELVTEDSQPVRRLAAATALLAAVLNTFDASLLATTSTLLGDDYLRKTAVFVSAAAIELTPNDEWVATQALSASVNDVPDIIALDERLRDLDIPTDSWVDAIRLYVALVGGYRPTLEALRSRPVYDAAWARLGSLYATVLMDGVTAETREGLREMLGTAAPRDAVEIACILADRSAAQAVLKDEERLRSEVPEAIEQARALAGYAFDSSVSEEDYLRRALPLCPSRSDVGWVANVILPLVAVARGTIVDVALEGRIATLLAERGRELDRETWQDELGRREPLLLAAGRIWAGRDGRVGVDTMSEAAADLHEQRLDAAMTVVAAEAARVAFDTAGRHLASRLANAVADGTTPSRDLASQAASEVWGPSLRVALAFLAGDADTVKRAAISNLAEALQVVQPAVEGAATDAGRWWRLNDYVESHARTAGGPSLAEQLRESMLPRLADLVGLTNASDRPYRNSLAFVLGSDFIPDDPTRDWDVITTLISAMQEQIKAATGFACPPMSVGADPLYRDTLRVLVHDSPLAQFRLPTSGRIVPGGPPDRLRDLLSGRPVTVPDGDTGGAELPGWTPTEFAVRQVEAVVLAHLDIIVQVTDMAVALADVDPGLAERVLSDASPAVRCLDLFRAGASDGLLREPTAVRRLADEALSGSGEGSTSRG